MTTFSHSHTIQQPHSRWLTLFEVIGASIFLAILSQIRIPLPFTIVPITLQSFGILLLGATLGSKKTAAAILLYFAQIVAGLPVLPSGEINPLVFIGPKGGYYLGFLAQGILMGWFAEKKIISQGASLFIGGIISTAALWIMGMTVLCFYVGSKAVWTMGLLPFIPGDLLKIIAMTYLLTRTKRE